MIGSKSPQAPLQDLALDNLTEKTSKPSDSEKETPEKPPSHGGEIFKNAQALGRSRDEILDFSVNLNPLGPPPGLLPFLEKNASLALYYPDPWNEAAAKDLSNFYSIAPEHVLPGAGSTPLIYALPRVLKPKRTIIIAPCFAEYGEGLKAAGLKFGYALASPENDFLVTPELVERVLELKPDLIFIAPPANPTGRLVPQESMELLLRAAKRKGGPNVILDEAFIDFCPEAGASFLKAATLRPKFFVLRSLTKVYCVPGLRLGFAAGDRRALAAAKALLGPWSIPTISQLAIKILLEETKYLGRTPEASRELGSELKKALRPWRQFPSDANYVLMSLLDKTREYRELFKSFLWSRAIVVRYAGNMPWLEDGYFRFAVRSLHDINFLYETLKDFRKNAREKGL